MIIKTLVDTGAPSVKYRRRRTPPPCHARRQGLNTKKQSTKDIKVARKKEGERFVLSEFPRIGGIDSPIKNETVEITQHQLLVLSILKGPNNGLTYKYLQERTGLQLGSLSTAIMAETKQGKKNPHSLMSRQLVSGSQHEDTDYLFQLTAKGRKHVS